MTLVFDNRSALGNGNGLHALIAGVSAYRHLPDGRGELGTRTFDLKQLSVAATSAYKVYEWLKQRQEYLAAPLATVRLLLSPALTESHLEGIADPCTWANFVKEVSLWRADASTDSNDATLFYFAGHGIIRNRSDSVLLCEDFAEPLKGPLPNVVAFDNIFYGMGLPADPEQKRANRQFYFIDACRQFPAEFEKLEKIDTQAIFEVELNGTDNRAAPVFHSAAPGDLSYSAGGSQTLFSMALLRCLDGLGSEALPEDDSGRVNWHVSVRQLNSVLPDSIKELNKKYNTDQDYEPVGIFRDATIHFLDEPPTVDGILKVIPSEALPFITVDVLDNHRQSVWQLSPPGPNPDRRPLKAGSYQVNTMVTKPPQPPYVDSSRQYPVAPPSFVLRARPLNDDT